MATGSPRSRDSCPSPWSTCAGAGRSPPQRCSPASGCPPGYRECCLRADGGAPGPQPEECRGGSGRMAAVFEHSVDVRWRDVDALDHVNHAVFLTYLEEGRDAFYVRLLGGDPSYVVVRLEVDLRAEVRYEDRRGLGRVGAGRVGAPSLAPPAPITPPPPRAGAAPPPPPPPPAPP